MPHVIVKLWPGKSEKQKAKLAEEITRAVMTVLNYGEESVSVAMEEVKPNAWMDKVYNQTSPASRSRFIKSRVTLLSERPRLRASLKRSVSISQRLDH